MDNAQNGPHFVRSIPMRRRSIYSRMDHLNSHLVDKSNKVLWLKFSLKIGNFETTKRLIYGPHEVLDKLQQFFQR